MGKVIYYFIYEQESFYKREHFQRKLGKDYGPSGLFRFLDSDIKNNKKFIYLGMPDKPDNLKHRRYKNIKNIVIYEEYLSLHYDFITNNYTHSINNLLLNFSSTRETFVNFIKYFSSINNKTLILNFDIFTGAKKCENNIINAYNYMQYFSNNNNTDKINVINIGVNPELTDLDEENFINNKSIYIDNLAINEASSTKKLENIKNIIDNIKLNYDSIIVNFSFEVMFTEYFKGQSFKNIYPSGLTKQEVISIFEYLSTVNNLHGVHYCDFNPLVEDYFSGNFYAALVKIFVNRIIN